MRGKVSKFATTLVRKARYRSTKPAVCLSRVFLLYELPVTLLPQSSGFHRQFPYDIVCVITAWVAVIHPESLRSLALTNKTFSTAVDKWIWRDIAFHWHSRKVHTFSRLDKRLDAIIGNSSPPHRPYGIESLTLNFNSHFPPGELSRFRGRLGLLMQKTTNLKRLKIWDTLDKLELGPLLTREVDPRTFQLVELNFQPPITPSLYHFLALQPMLRRLLLHGTLPIPCDDAEADTELQPDAVPVLESIHAPLDVLDQFITGRPIRYVSTIVNASNVQRLREILPKSSHPLTSLSIRFSGPRIFQHIMKDLPTITPSLQFLSCIWEDATLSGMLDIDFTPLRSMDDLECVRWCGSRMNVYFHTLSEEWHPSRYAGPSLHFVQFEALMDADARRKEKIVAEGMWVRELDGWKIRPGQYVAFPLELEVDYFVS